MTDTQKQALAAMSSRNLGAVVTRLGWTWPHMIRSNEDAALAVLEVLK